MHNQPKATQTTHSVFLALVAGIIVGEVLNLSFVDHDHATSDTTFKLIIQVLSVATDIFLRLIKMIIAPLVFATLVVGMANMEDTQTVGRIGIKALLWFFSASLLSLLLGLILVNTLEPGIGLAIPLPEITAQTGLNPIKPSLSNFAEHIFPKSIVEAMATNEILQIVVFSVFFGFACAALGELAQPMVKSLDALVHIMLKMTSYVMRFAPVAVFSALTAIIAQKGISVLLTYGKFIAEFYFGLLSLSAILIGIAWLILRRKVWLLLSHIKEPMLLAFGTASSESAYPKLLQQLERYGCKEKVCSFVLPLGYSFNLDGSMMYMTFAVIFIAQAYGITLPLSDQVLMLLILLFSSKGVAGVPRASLIVISATLTMFNIPEAGLLLLLGIDQLLDMGRSATNVLGNSIAAAVIDLWEERRNRKHHR